MTSRRWWRCLCRAAVSATSSGCWTTQAQAAASRQAGRQAGHAVMCERVVYTQRRRQQLAGGMPMEHVQQQACGQHTAKALQQLATMNPEAPMAMTGRHSLAQVRRCAGACRGTRSSHAFSYWSTGMAIIWHRWSAGQDYSDGCACSRDLWLAVFATIATHTSGLTGLLRIA